MEIIHAQIADGIGVIAVKIDQGLEAVLFPGVKQPVDRTLTGTGNGIDRAVVIEKVIEEVIPDHFPAGIALIAQRLCDIGQIGFQRLQPISGPEPFT